MTLINNTFKYKILFFFIVCKLDIRYTTCNIFYLFIAFKITYGYIQIEAIT